MSSTITPVPLVPRPRGLQDSPQLPAPGPVRSARRVLRLVVAAHEARVPF